MPRGSSGRMPAGVVLAALVFGVFGCGGGKVTPPTEFTGFVAKDGAFALDYPSGWDVEGGARPDNTHSWAEFSKGSATIRVIADTTGSLIADIAKSFGGEALDEESAPVAQAHDLKRDVIAQDFSNYREGPTSAIQTQLGDSRIAAFFAGGGPAGRRSGLRCTMLTQNRRITVLCHCPASQFDALQPAFEKVLLSVRRR